MYDVVVVGGHFLVEVIGGAPEWFKKAYFSNNYDAVPMRGSWGKAVLLLSKSPRYFGDAPPLFDIDKAISYVERYGEKIGKKEWEIMTTNYPLPVADEWIEQLKNYNAGSFQGVFSMRFYDELDELVTVYDFLGIEIKFKRHIVDDGYFLHLVIPPGGETYRSLAWAILDELKKQLRDDEKILLKRISGKKHGKWLHVEGTDWTGENALFVLYYGKVKRMLNYPVDVIEV